MSNCEKSERRKLSNGMMKTDWTYLDSEKCPARSEWDAHKFFSRKVASPTGRRADRVGCVRVMYCWCGVMKPLRPEELTYRQARWVERWNAAMIRAADMI